MFDNPQFTELMAQSRRDAIEESIRRNHDLSIIGRPDRPFSVRGTLASALVRLALLVDGNAGRAATIAHS
jgi:hypothetical protein